MKKAKQDKQTKPVQKNAHAGYGSQDFEQGRGGMQSGHSEQQEEVFNQFQNAGNAGYAAETSVNGNRPEKSSGK